MYSGVGLGITTAPSAVGSCFGTGLRLFLEIVDCPGVLLLITDFIWGLGGGVWISKYCDEVLRNGNTEKKKKKKKNETSKKRN